MKKTLLLLLFIAFQYHVSGQHARMNFDLQRKMLSATDDKEIAVFVQGDIKTIKEQTERLGGVFKYAAGDIAAIRIHMSKLTELSRISSIRRIESNDLKLQPLNDQMIRNNHVLEVQNGFNLPQNYDGTGVVMGIIDEGIDFTHPDFRDEFGRTRLKYVWDQSIINTDPTTQPQPYGYGKQYIGAQVDTSTQFHDSQFSHGSHVAGIACGNGLAVNNYTGVAPKADIIVVKMDLTRSDNEFLTSLVDAVKYVFDRASQLGEPAVINISLGTYFGSHDAKDIQALAIDNLVSDSVSRVIVCAAGNLGYAPIHLGYNLSTDTNYTWFQYSSGSVYFQVWGDSGNFENANVALSLQRRNRNNFSDVVSLPFIDVTSNTGTIVTDTLKVGNNRIGIVQRLVQNWGNRYSIEYEIVPDSIRTITPSDTTDYLWKLAATGSGRMDAWSFDMVFDNLPDTISLPSIRYYQKPDLTQNIVSSFTCSDKIITVGSYTNRNYYTNANFAITRDTSLHVGDLSIFSSHGPTRDGRIKPDIMATGEWVLSCGAQAELNILVGVEPDKVAAGRKHKRSSGTSMSSPVVAGVAALYLQKNPGADYAEVKSKIISCATQDGFTGTSLPNNIWGYGKVNAYGTVKGCTIGIDELNPYAFVDFAISPNPSTTSTQLQYDLTSAPSHKKADIAILDATGRIVNVVPLNAIANSLTINTENLPQGIYFVALRIDGRNAKVLRLSVL